jgi:hypothetical protein
MYEQIRDAIRAAELDDQKMAMFHYLDFRRIL